MEENKKPKRRRIGESQEMNGESGHFEKVTYNPKASFVPTDSAQGAPVEGGSDAAPRQDYRRPNYNNQNSYNSYGNNRQGGYNNNRQGGYNNYNNRQGGYNNRQGGYNNRQGGYNNNRQGGYNNNRQGGYNNNNRQGGYNNNRPGASFNRQGGQRFTPRPKQIVYDVPEVDPNEEVRLNKFMANAGICSRREADELIQQGLVKVNGNVVTELGSKIKRDDVVEYNDKVVTLENKCYILLNKPKDCVTTSDDPDGRLTVMDIVKNACKERIYPVGRLDRNTTGVLLLTNDGDLASKLTHPKYVKKKIYQVWTDKDIAEDDMQQLADGIELEDGPIHADAISYVNDHDKNQAGIEIHSGRNRIVRRMFESLGYRVTKLDRVYFAGLTKKNLPRGRWRYLTQEEVNFLKQGSFE
jgi:23S rRNA pseudouridine2605 synthase